MTVPDRLFRQEVIEFKQLQRDWGGIVLLQPLSTKLLAWSLVTSTMVIVAFLCLAQYARKEAVVGYLTLSDGRARILASQPGTIRSVHVKEGQVVDAGQQLLTIETAQIAADGRDVNALLLDTLTRQRVLLMRQMVAEEQRTASERNRLMATIRAHTDELSQLEAMIQLQAQRVELSTSSVSAAASLSQKGAISEIELRRRRQEGLEHQQELKSFQQQVAARQVQLTEANSALEQLPTVMQQKIQLLRNELVVIEQRIAEVEGRRAYVIRAPAAGKVTMLQAAVGQAVDPRHLQMEILPTGSTLQAELFIPTRAAGFVEVGQEVRFRYDAFPYQRFGTYRGRIAAVSQTVVTNDQISAPVTLSEPAYRAIAA